jgi:hypothetical protein
MSALKQVAANFYKPNWWREEAIPALGYKYTMGVRKLSKYSFDPSVPELDLMAEDWDNAIILDACRFDQFESMSNLDGQLEERISLGASSPEFIEQTFSDATYHDTVCVTANPHYRRLGYADTFHDLIDVWDFGWDDEHKTVLPGTMVEAAIDAQERYPQKRLLIHFMQPHYPFIGPSGEKIDKQRTFGQAPREGFTSEDTYDSVWERLDRGELSESLVIDAYNENLEIALPHVESLLDSLEGRSVVTADHGNLLGEKVPPFRKPVYGHPTYVYAEGVRNVPYLITESKPRKTITSEQPNESSDTDSELVSDRLEALGYT